MLKKMLSLMIVAAVFAMILPAALAAGLTQSSLSVGSTGEEVRALQEELVRYGYLTWADVDGVYGPITASAVHEFKRCNGIPDNNIHNANECVYDTNVWVQFNSGDIKSYEPVDAADNILMSDIPSEEDVSAGTGKVLGSDIDRAAVCSITFMDSYSGMNENAWDVSAEGDGRVMAWVVPNGNMYDLYIGAEGGVTAPEEAYMLFGNYTAVQKINFMGNFYTTGCTSMAAMFYNCGRLVSLDLSGFDTSSVINMNWMFSGCASLESVNLSSFDTSNVIAMNSMFSYCNAITELDLRGFDTQNVTDMHAMFNWCTSLEKVDVSSFDTTNVTDMALMFGNCNALQQLDLSNFNTGNVTTMLGMFYSDRSLSSLNLSSFDTGSVTTMQGMFYGCSSLAELDVTNFTTSNVTDMYLMFYECSGLTELDVSGFDTSNVTDMSFMFAGCISLTGLDISGFDMDSALTDNMLYNVPVEVNAGAQAAEGDMWIAGYVFDDNNAPFAGVRTVIGDEGFSLYLPEDAVAGKADGYEYAYYFGGGAIGILKYDSSSVSADVLKQNVMEVFGGEYFEAEFNGRNYVLAGDSANGYGEMIHVGDNGYSYALIFMPYDDAEFREICLYVLSSIVVE